MNGLEHERDNLRAFGFNGDGDHQEPFFVFGSCEGGGGGEGLGVGEVGVRAWDGEVPEVEGRVGGARWEFEVVGDFEEWAGDGWGEDLR